MRFAAATFALFLAAPAQAGGVGLLLNGGLHTEDVYFYSKVNSADPTVEYSDVNDYEQFQLVEFVPNYGGGLELILGDRDDRILGSFRLYYNQDAPQVDPATVTDEVAPANVVAAYREDPHHVGVAYIGLSWGFLGDPANFQFGASGHLGSGFLTTDHTEFLTFDLGPMVSYRFARQTVLFADLVYQGRIRKEVSHGANFFAGIRYMFD